MLTSRAKKSGLVFALSSLALCSYLCAPVFAQAEPVEEKEAPAAESEAGAKNSPGFEEMREHRQRLRQDLMMPSLKGLRGISYGIPGHNPFPELDKVVATRLKQLPIKVHNIKDCHSGDTKPVDGVLQLKVLAAGNNLTLVELTLTQWSQLSRDPNIHTRAITYADQAITHNATVNDVAGKMVNQFVLDYLKVNSTDDEKKSEKSDKKASKKASKKG